MIHWCRHVLISSVPCRVGKLVDCSTTLQTMRPVMPLSDKLRGCGCCTSLRARVLAAHMLMKQAPASKSGLKYSGGLMGKNLVQVPVSMPDHLVEKLKAKAEEEGRSFDEVLTMIAEAYLFPNARAAESMDTLYVLEPIITLVDGLLHGEHTVSQALRHGDVGLGTLDMLDGEVVVYEGVPYHQTADGSVHVLQGHEKTPFMTLANWDPSNLVTMQLREDTNYEGLQKLMQGSVFRSNNVFYAMEIKGHFSTIKARAVRKQASHRRLVEVAADQALFSFEEQDGVLVGFFSPDYMGSAINVPGFHLHYLSDDRQRGGHLLNCLIKAGATINVQEIHRFKVDLPFREDFMGSKFDGDTKKDIEASEKEK